MHILLLTRYYPPEVTGGARRPHALVGALRKLGVIVTVCAPNGADDEKLIGVPHPSFPAFVPTTPGQGTQDDGIDRKRAAQFLDWCRANLLLPDPEIRWALRALKYISMSGDRYDWIITSSPPESLHIAGAILKARLGSRWIADIRDLWIENPQRKELRQNPIRIPLERWIAQWCFSRADGLIGVSDIVVAEAKRFSAHKVPTCVIGHFAEAFNGTPETLPAETFNIVHTGSVELSNPLSQFAPLLEDFEDLVVRCPHAHLWLAGRLSPSEQAQVQNSLAASNITMLGQVNMARARSLQKGANALALVSGTNSHALPGKFSEYSQTGLPILLSALGPWKSLIPHDANIQTWQDIATSQHAALTSQQSDPTSSSADKAGADILNFMRRISAS